MAKSLRRITLKLVGKEWHGELAFAKKSSDVLAGLDIAEFDGKNAAELLRQMADEIELTLPKPRRFKPFEITLEQFRADPATWMKKRTPHRSVVVRAEDGSSVMTIC